MPKIDYKQSFNWNRNNFYDNNINFKDQKNEFSSTNPSDSDTGFNSKTQDSDSNKSGSFTTTSITTNTLSGCNNENSESMKSIWQRFALNSSIHGLSYVQERNRNIISRIVWCLLVLFMVATLGFLLIKLLLDYRDYPFTSVWNLHRESAIATPTITMCPMNVYNYNKINQSDVALRIFTDESWWIKGLREEEKRFLNMTYSQMHTKFGFSKDDLITQIRLFHGKNFVNISADAVSSRFNTGSLCFTLNDFRHESSEIQKTLTSDHIIEIIFDLRRQDYLPGGSSARGLYMWMHKYGTTNSWHRPLLIAPGFSYYIIFKRTDYVFLPLPYKSFGNQGCVDISEESNFVNPLLTFPIYTMDNCLVELLEKMSAERCGCAVKSYTQIYQVEECTVYQVFFCVYAVTWELEKNLTSGVENDATQRCPHACNDSIIDMSYSTFRYDPKVPSHSSDKDPDMIVLSFQAKTTNIETIEHVPEMTLVKVLATVGGYLGLFLGASLLTGAEFVEVLMLSIRHWFRSKRK